VLEHAKHGGDMTMGTAAHDIEGVAERLRDTAAFECSAKCLDLLGGPVGQVCEGSLANLAPLSPALPQQNRRARVAIGHNFDIHGNFIQYLTFMVQCKYELTWKHRVRLQMKESPRLTAPGASNWAL
jgi:hypothetical protein